MSPKKPVSQKTGETDDAHPKNSGPVSQELIERLRNAVTYYNYRYFSETLLCRQYGMVGMAERNTTEFNSGRASCGGCRTSQAALREAMGPCGKETASALLTILSAGWVFM